MEYLMLLDCKIMVFLFFCKIRSGSENQSNFLTTAYLFLFGKSIPEKSSDREIMRTMVNLFFDHLLNQGTILYLYFFFFKDIIHKF